MFKAVKRITFSYGHRLSSHEGRCRRIHGHNASVDIVCEAGDLDGKGMVIDFSMMEREARAFIDNNLDHRMILKRDDPLATALHDAGDPPFMIDGDPTAENLARIIYHALKDRGLPVAEVRFGESPASCAIYREGK